MFNKLKHILTISAAKSLLQIDENTSLSTGKRIISIIAGIYMVQKGLNGITKNPILSIQEAVIGGLLLYNGATGMEKPVKRKPTKISDVRRNQIQGNDPNSEVPAFV